ncbi:hypothetical protein T440DRAFT_505975 [Plenodomus tracheiphilus IPT5]|uniref:Family c-likeg-protein-coupled receptor protein n=1 Tax=Plenodomus tracheiphilus IPT5 TaxID=1408161 RepID=A0A6A7BF31_9PLEO|nr:hypothetical protein T440DRAFT_505975 [Plenodomus tracheiphilus IPT5]
MPLQMTNHGPPWAPTTWALGGAPKKSIDLPVTAVFLALFMIGAATHMTIFQLNRRRGHKFLFNGALFGFCMSRIVTCILRIASVSLPHDIPLSIAATIFVAAGVLIIFVINLLWSQRILRSLHPHIGWHPSVSIAFKALYVLIFLTLAINITAVVQSFYTLRPRTRKIDRSLQLYGTTFFACISSLPIFVVLFSVLFPRKGTHDRFGAGRLRTKIFVLLTGAFLATLGAWYRCGTLWVHPVPKSEPLPAYFHKALFYIMDFTLEITIVYFYAIMRVDLRFHIPNGAKGPGSYAKHPESTTGGDEEKPRQLGSEGSREPLR